LPADVVGLRQTDGNEQADYKSDRQDESAIGPVHGRPPYDGRFGRCQPVYVAPSPTARRSGVLRRNRRTLAIELRRATMARRWSRLANRPGKPSRATRG